MTIAEEHEALLKGFLEELDWFISVAREATLLEDARDSILDSLKKARNSR